MQGNLKLILINNIMKEKTYHYFKPKTDFEKLLFANSYIKLLKKEVSTLRYRIGVMSSNHDELIDSNKEMRVREAQKRQICGLEAKNKTLKFEKQLLIIELIDLRNK